MSGQRLMKDGLADDAVNRIAAGLEAAWPKFPSRRFKKDALVGLDDLELKDRVRHLIEVLGKHFPSDFRETAKILKRVPANWDRGEKGDPLRGFAAWPLIDYVGVYGLEHPALALEVLKKLTPMFSAEFAIRPFVIHHFEPTFARLLKWTADSDEHVRRLVSEGTRPRLPWEERLPRFMEDPSPCLELLEALNDDPSEYVRRSVANHLNDISKDNPDIAIKTCRRWLKGATKERRWIVERAARSLVKTGPPEVFPLLGYTARPKVSVQSLKMEKKRVRVGGTLEFAAVLESMAKSKQRVVLDYAVHHMKANGRTTAKVFKWRDLTLEPGERIELSKSHSFKPITTRNYYAGRHSIEVLVNGVPCAEAGFALTV